MSRLVTVSNRVSLPARSGAQGGLAVGISAALKTHGGVWFGWSGEVESGHERAADVTRRGGIHYATVDLSAAEHQDYYLGFCNSVLWPLFHYFVDAVHYNDDQYESYLRVNERFAHGLNPLLQPDDLIWVHDYHLIPLAGKLRELGVTAPIGLFIHTPFPHVEALRVLPVYRELCRAMLEYDVIGFQTASDLDAFRSAIAHLWGADTLAEGDMIVVDQRTVHAAVFPIGVDVDVIQKEGREAQTGASCRKLVAGLHDRKLMIGVDRLDYSKGLVARFRAYEQFLEQHAENRNRVTFLQIAPLSREHVRAYSVIRSELEQAAGRTNGRFADTDWTPIRYLNRNFSHDTLMGFMRLAPVGIVTPVRDGMNLVAKEFVAAQDAHDPGVLILSEMAGAARELSSALLVNPYDIRGVAHAIQLGLNMSLPERRERHKAMIDTLRRADITAWRVGFLAALAATAGGVSGRPTRSGA